MSPAELTALNHDVLWAAFLLSAGFGAIVQRTGFCTMGAVSDAFAMGDWTRLRQWAMAAAVATLAFALFASLGWIAAPQTLYANPRWLWLSALVGGGLFGIGMVLSSGCISKNLVRVGDGNLKALVVMLVTGITAFATLKGLTAVWRVRTVDQVAIDFGQNTDLATWTAELAGLPPAVAALLAGGLVGSALL
ncbi:MAG TPA: YeeE/YedE thiosulfate transporter family protein, partial [Ramlibacter sp.]|nr:YeeE/YedE thiosulfate transporter family protein [Ramlibacter sp.]